MLAGGAGDDDGAPGTTDEISRGGSAAGRAAKETSATPWTAGERGLWQPAGGWERVRLKGTSSSVICTVNESFRPQPRKAHGAIPAGPTPAALPHHSASAPPTARRPYAGPRWRPCCLLAALLAAASSTLPPLARAAAVVTQRAGPRAIAGATLSHNARQHALPAFRRPHAGRGRTIHGSRSANLSREPRPRGRLFSAAAREHWRRGRV